MSEVDPASRAAPGIKSDAGFTLVELVVAIVVLTLIIGAIAGAVITSITTSNGVSGRLSDSASEEITSAYYIRDVESAAFLTTTSAATSPTPCGVGTAAAAGLNFDLAMDWGTSTTVNNVSYWTDPTSGDLVRLFCVSGTTTPATTGRIPMGLSPSYGLTSVITPSSYSTAASAGWTSTIGISGVSLSTLQSSSVARTELLGVPRVTQPVGNGGTPSPPPLLLLGSGTSILNCSGNNGSVSVVGSAVINSTQDGAGALGNSNFQATNIYTADPTPGSSITTGPNGSFNPNPPAYTSPVTDPYASLVPPTGAGLPTDPATSRAGNTVTYYPGIYTTQLNLTGSSNYVFSSGLYILRNGLKATGSGTVSSGGGGDFFYITGGAFDLSGGNGATLGPLTVPLYPAAPSLLIWQASSDSSQMYLSGNGSVTTISGGIYAPNAVVGGGGNGTYTVGFLTAKGFACNGNGSANIGG